MKDTIGSPGSRSTYSLGSQLAALLVVAALAACSTVPPLPPEPSDPGVVSTSWRSMPHSWARLQALEDWLIGPGPRLQPTVGAEAELLLAEGRLRFARSEQRTLAAGAMKQRLGAAEGGFRRVLSSPAADALYRDRARHGLDEVRELRGGSTTPSRPGALARATWGAKAANRSNLTASRGKWSRITVHHTAMHSSTLGRGTQGEVAHALQGIQRQHMRDRGFGDIGYHFLIDPQGRVWNGRSLLYQGAHASGSNNVANLGVCLLGSFDRERPTARALATLERLVDDLRREYGIGRQRIFGHCNFKVTACPGRHLMPWVDAYRRGPVAARR